MTLKTVGWLLVLCAVCFALVVAGVAAWQRGAPWALGLVALVWGVLVLADAAGRTAWRDLAWAANAGCALAAAMAVDDATGLPRWAMVVAVLLCLCLFPLVPALLAALLVRWREARYDGPPSD